MNYKSKTGKLRDKNTAYCHNSKFNRTKNAGIIVELNACQTKVYSQSHVVTCKISLLNLLSIRFTSGRCIRHLHNSLTEANTHN